MTYIYAIQHNKTKRIYIGKSKDIYRRYREHIRNLRSGTHSSTKMTEDYRIYGEDYSLFVLEEIENAKEKIYLNDRDVTKGSMTELKWMEKYDTIENGYNDHDHVAKKMILLKEDPIPLKDGIPEVP